MPELFTKFMICCGISIRLCRRQLKNAHTAQLTMYSRCWNLLKWRFMKVILRLYNYKWRVPKRFRSPAWSTEFVIICRWNMDLKPMIFPVSYALMKVVAHWEQNVACIPNEGMHFLFEEGRIRRYDATGSYTVPAKMNIVSAHEDLRMHSVWVNLFRKSYRFSCYGKDKNPYQ